MNEKIRSSLEWVLQALFDTEATSEIGAARYERAESRVAQRNGYRPRLFSTPAGDVEVGIPKLREGAFFPSLLERRPHRPGAVCRGHGGLGAWGVDPQGR